MNRTVSSIALRNVARNRRRTLFTLATLALGGAGLIIMVAMSRATITLLEASAIHGQFGALLVYRTGYFAEAKDGRMLGLSMPYTELRERVLAVKGVQGVTGRLRFAATLGHGGASAVVLGTAIDPTWEGSVCVDYRRYYDPKGDGFASGDEEVFTGGRELMAGIAGVPSSAATSAEALGLGEVTLQGSSPDGRQNALTVKLKNLSAGGMGGMGPPNLVAVPLALAQRLLGMDGRVTELAVAVAPGVDRDELTTRIMAALGADYEVRTWESLMPFVPGLAQQHALLIALVAGILGTFVAFSVANTMQMCVQERVGEIGTMMAIGADASYIRRIFLTEAMTIGLSGAVGAILFGSVVTLFFARIGIPLGDAVPMFEGGLRPVLEPYVPTLVFVGVIALATVAGVLPAVRAARLGPADALRRV